jgi:hypothetical protein
MSGLQFIMGKDKDKKKKKKEEVESESTSDSGPDDVRTFNEHLHVISICSHIVVCKRSANYREVHASTGKLSC